MTRILLTGFEPFLGRRVNPSWEAVRQLDGEVISGDDDRYEHGIDAARDDVNAFRVACEVLATHTGPDAVSRRWPTATLPLR